MVCLPGAKIEAITERVKNIVGSGKGGSVLVHVGTRLRFLTSNGFLVHLPSGPLAWMANLVKSC